MAAIECVSCYSARRVIWAQDRQNQLCHECRTQAETTAGIWHARFGTVGTVYGLLEAFRAQLETVDLGTF